MVSFFNELEIKKAFSWLVSFFNKLEIRKEFSCWFLDHGFEEGSSLEGHHVKGKNLAMASKRYSFGGSNTLWKEQMSRVTIGVRISGSNSPTNRDHHVNYQIQVIRY
jgi:hypothetical protein